MGDKSKIEWTEATWNPVRGCSVISEGCRNCYAMSVAARFSGEGQAYEGLAYRNGSGAHWTGKVRLIEQHLEDPLRWKRPRRIFVISMSDLFHESIPDEWIESIFAVMLRARRHTFQVLTKRPARMLDFMNRNSTGGRLLHLAGELNHKGVDEESGEWPRKNIWLGVSVEDQKTADERIPLLLQTPAAVRWISAEPLLGPIDLESLTGLVGEKYQVLNPILCSGDSNRPAIDWVVVGGESGAGARPFDLAWARSIVQQCKAAGVAVFVKQLGSKAESIPDRISYRGSKTPKPDGFYRHLSNSKGGDINEWPEDLRVREYPE